MPDSIRVLCLGFGRSELRMMQLALDAAAHTLPRAFRIVKADEHADVAVVDWSTLNIERTQAFLAQRFPDLPIISVSETGVLGAPGLCSSEDLLLQSLPALVYEAIEGVEPAARAKPPEYVSWLSVRRHWVGDELPADQVVQTARLELTPPKTTASTAAPPTKAPSFVPAPAASSTTKKRVDAEGVPAFKPTKALPQHPLSDMRLMLATPNAAELAADLATLRQLGAAVSVSDLEADIVRAFIRPSVDLILIDARWPMEKGYQLCRTLAHHPQKSRVPIIMVAADLRPIERARAAYAGSLGLMRWPITEAQVIERVPNLSSLRRARPEAMG